MVYFSCLDIWISKDQQNVLALGWCSFWRATTKFCWFRVLRTWGTKFILKQVQGLKWIDNQNSLTRAMWWKSQCYSGTISCNYVGSFAAWSCVWTTYVTSRLKAFFFSFFSLLSLKHIVIFPWFKVVFLFYYYFKFDHHYFNYLFIFLFFCRILFSISNLNLNFFFIILLLFKNNPHYFNCYFFYFEFFVKLIIF